MMQRSTSVLLLAAIAIAMAAPVHAADPTFVCHKTIVKQLEKFKKIHLKKVTKCLDKQNDGNVEGPCPDALTEEKITATNAKVAAKIALKCTMAHIAALGYRADCAYGGAATGVESECAALPATTPTEFAECLKCWKEAQFARYEATLYPSHAVELCGSLDATSATCSDLGCTAPLPEQRNIQGGGEEDCQRGIGKAGVRYLLKREKIFEKCLLKGGTAESCAADATVQVKLERAETQKVSLIRNKCGNRVPSANADFCCRCGPMGGVCMVVPDRATCLSDSSCVVMEGKMCDTGTGRCENAPKQITWWESCPTNDPCPGATLGDLNALIDCVDTTADAIVDRLLCLQFPGYPCATPVPPPATPTATPTP